MCNNKSLSGLSFDNNSTRGIRSARFRLGEPHQGREASEEASESIVRGKVCENGAVAIRGTVAAIQ